MNLMNIKYLNIKQIEQTKKLNENDKLQQDFELLLKDMEITLQQSQNDYNKLLKEYNELKIDKNNYKKEYESLNVYFYLLYRRNMKNLIFQKRIIKLQWYYFNYFIQAKYDNEKEDYDNKIRQLNCTIDTIQYFIIY